METITNTDNAPAARSAINNNFSSLGSGYARILQTDNAPTLIGKLNDNFALAAQQGGGSGGSSSNGPVNVVEDYGAVGDGITDDTRALELAFAAGFAQNRPVYFPGGTTANPKVYLIRRSLQLKSNMEIYGDGKDKTIIRKKQAVFTTLTTGTDKDATKVYLANTSGLSEGDEFYISSSKSTNAYVTFNGGEQARTCTYGRILTIGSDSGGNYITFESPVNYTDSVYHGTFKAHESGCVFSTSHAILRGWSSDECCNVFIHDLQLDGNRKSDEPLCWCNSLIHFEPGNAGSYGFPTTLYIDYSERSYNHIVSNCKLVNSSADAISDQGEGGLLVSNCEINNCAMHGVHCGTTFSGAVIKNNYMYGSTTSGFISKGAGVFWCQSVTDIVVANNHIYDFNKGCSDQEFGTSGKYSIIRGNDFHRIISYVFDFSKDQSEKHDGGLIIIGNTIEELKKPVFNGLYLKNVIISGNTISSYASGTSQLATLINITNSDTVIIKGNTRPQSEATITALVVSTNTTNILNDWNS